MLNSSSLPLAHWTFDDFCRIRVVESQMETFLAEMPVKRAVYKTCEKTNAKDQGHSD